MIGPEGDAAAESFDFEVCSPKWLLQHRTSKEVIFGRHMILAFDYDIRILESQLRRLCSRTVADSWQEIAARLARFGHWEFEDYRD